MSQKQHRTAKRRAEKRHRREVERRQARTVARKQSLATNVRLDAFQDDGVPSADEETSIHPYLTQRWREREQLVRRRPRRPRGMHRFWTHAEVAALDEDILLAELAARGVVVARADVLAHIARMPVGGSAWQMSRIHWLPTIAAHVPSAADRDFLGLAAVELWRRLRPDDPPLESLLALLADAEDLRADDDHGGYLAGLVRFLAAIRDRVDSDEPEEIGGVHLPLGSIRTRMVITAARLVEQCPELAADAAAVAERWLDLVSTDDDASDRPYLLSTVSHLYEKLGRPHDAERVLRGAIAVAPDDLVARKLLALHLHEHAADDRARLVEALALWDSTRPPPDHPGMDRFAELRDEIVENLRRHDTPGARAS